MFTIMQSEANGLEEVVFTARAGGVLHQQGEGTQALRVRAEGGGGGDESRQLVYGGVVAAE